MEYDEFLISIRELFQIEETTQADSAGNATVAAVESSVVINVPPKVVPLRAMKPIAVPPIAAPPIASPQLEGQEIERGNLQLMRNSRLIRTFFRRRQYFNQ